MNVYDKGEHTHDATGDGVGAFDGEGEGGSVDAIGARVGLFVGEFVGGSVDPQWLYPGLRGGASDFTR